MDRINTEFGTRGGNANLEHASRRVDMRHGGDSASARLSLRESWRQMLLIEQEKLERLCEIMGNRYRSVGEEEARKVFVSNADILRHIEDGWGVMIQSNRGRELLVVNMGTKGYCMYGLGFEYEWMPLDQVATTISGFLNNM